MLLVADTYLLLQLPHMHLVSRYRYPVMHMLPTDTVVEYLLSAPKIVRELQPMHWTFLDGPPDGTVMLTWQPLNHLGTNFASDGYVWADVEQAFTFEARGYVRQPVRVAVLGIWVDLLTF